MGKKAGFIPGIYNFCDRWCERCAMQERCMSFVMGKKLEERGDFDEYESELKDDGSWSKFKKVFDLTYDVLREIADEMGVTVSDIYASENINREYWGEDFETQEKDMACFDRIKNSDIICICLIYERLADNCLERIFYTLDDDDDSEEEEEVAEALKTISWYLDLVQSKMRRALYGLYTEVPEHKDSDDYNGSAKIALIGIDKSLESWLVLAGYSPDCSHEIQQLRVVLGQLKQDVEQAFPKARKFLRPGFEK